MFRALLARIFKNKGIVWKIGHWIFENNTVRRIVSPLVNLFKPNSVMIDGHIMFIDKNDRVISLELLISGKWEEYEANLFEDSIKEGDVVIDVGANIGYYTLIAAKKVGQTGKVFAFEPSLRNFQLLKKNVEANGYTNVVLVNKALSDKNGEGRLFSTNEDNYGDLRIFNSGGKRDAAKIELITLDSFLKNWPFEVSLIKMDIQGAEVKAFRGASKTIRKSKKLKLFTEFWPKGLSSSGSSGNEYLKLLRRSGFKIFEIDEFNKKVVEARKFPTLENLLCNKNINE